MKFMIKVSILGLLAGAMASMATASSFDRCKDEADVDRWKLWGSEASLPANLERCDCLMDADCVATCFQAAYGYSFECSFCFGALAICCVESGCMSVPCKLISFALAIVRRKDRSFHTPRLSPLALFFVRRTSNRAARWAVGEKPARNATVVAWRN